MYNELFRGFKYNNKVDVKIIEKYKDVVPVELISIWEQYGFGSILDGNLKLVNPDDYRSVVDMSYFRSNVSIPIMVTGFGDVITWEEDQYVGIIQYKYGTFHIMIETFACFLKLLNDKEFINEYFSVDQYNEAVAKWGELEYDQCFGYVPLLGLGGSEKVENLDKVKIREHIELITELVGKIE